MKKQRSINGLSKRFYDYYEFDTSSIFSISEVPSALKLGKNSFKISADKKRLISGSDVYIDIIDSNARAIYFEISSLVNRDGTRNVVVYIYEDTAPGPCALYIAGSVNNQTTTDYLFQTSIQVQVDKIVDNDINFLIPPKVTYQERQVPVQSYVTSSRYTERRNVSGSLWISSIKSPKNFNPSNLDIERQPISPFTGMPTVIDSKFGTDTNVEMPKYFDNTVITSDGFAFTESMEGGTITLNNISVVYPGDVVDSSVFQTLSYSASIIKVVNSSSIEVFPPFSISVSYRNSQSANRLYSVNSIKNHSNFTCSYYESLSLTNTSVTRSFVNFEIFGLDPEIGRVAAINVQYKPVKDFGNFRNLGHFDIGNQNFLISTNSIEFGKNEVIEKNIGFFKNGLSDFYNYWHTQSFGTGSIIVDDRSKVTNGVRLYQKSSRGTSDRWLLRPHHAYSIRSSISGQYELSFDSVSDSDGIFPIPPQLDLYISGSECDSTDDRTNRKLGIRPIKSSSFGTYVGSIFGSDGSVQSVKIPFVTKENKRIIPNFVFRSGIWSIGNIKLKSVSETGFTPNQQRFYIPLEDVDNTELILQLQYLNSVGKPCEYESKFYGVNFVGIPEPELIFGSSIKQSLGTGKKNIYLFQTSGTMNSSGDVLTVSFPIFSNEFDIPYTGSEYNFGVGYTVETIIYGKTGSFASPKDAYIWGSTVQGRSLWNPSDAVLSPAGPIFFGQNSFSGSSQYLLGTYGQGGSSSPIKPNLDSWLRVTTIYADSGNLNIRYTMTSTGSGVWDVYLVSTCNMIKYEQEV